MKPRYLGKTKRNKSNNKKESKRKTRKNKRVKKGGALLVFH